MKGPLTPKRWMLTVAAYAAPFALCLILLPQWGGVRTSVLQAFREWSSGAPGEAWAIVFQLRVPRVLMALMAGGSLAITGACFQAILRNPLAEPFTLGVTGGAAVGAVFALSFPALVVDLWAFTSVQVFALMGAAVVMALVYVIARRPHGISMNTLLLAGVTLGILCGGLVLLLRYLMNPHKLITADRWLMGGLETYGYDDFAKVLPFMALGLFLMLRETMALNQLSLGDQLAAGQGVDIGRTQRRVFLGGSLLTAAVVSLTGPIGFVGLIIPHAVRRVSGFDHRIVLPASFLLGGAFLAACDTVARTALSPREMPVGVITALIGGPIFIRILLGRRK